MLPPTLARRGGPWPRAEVPETRVFRLAPTPGTPPGELAGLLTDCGDLDELRARADTGDQYAPELAGQPTDRGEKRSGCAGWA